MANNVDDGNFNVGIKQKLTDIDAFIDQIGTNNQHIQTELVTIDAQITQIDDKITSMHHEFDDLQQQLEVSKLRCVTAVAGLKELNTDVNQYKTALEDANANVTTIQAALTLLNQEKTENTTQHRAQVAIVQDRLDKAVIERDTITGNLKHSDETLKTKEHELTAAQSSADTCKQELAKLKKDIQELYAIVNKIYNKIPTNTTSSTLEQITTIKTRLNNIKSHSLRSGASVAPAPNEELPPPPADLSNVTTANIIQGSSLFPATSEPDRSSRPASMTSRSQA